MSNPRKIIITGGAGFVGSQLGWKFTKDGHDVHLLDNLSYGYLENILQNGKPFCSFHQKDIRDTDLAKIFKGADTVFHLAAISALPVCQSQPAEAISINTAGTANVLECARLANVRRVIFASTSAIYENNTHYPCREDDDVSPTLIYSVSKHQGELLTRGFAKNYGMEIVTTRYYNVYGPQMDIHRKSPPFVAYLIRELLAGRQPILHSNGEQRRDYVYVGDVNLLNTLCMDHPAAVGQTYNVASGQTYSVNEIYAEVAKQLGSSIKPVFRESTKFWDKYPELFAGTRPLSAKKLDSEVNKFTLGSTFKAEHEIGWVASTTLADGIAATIAQAKQASEKAST
jgi:UDP-glucose 4-epimerase